MRLLPKTRRARVAVAAGAAAVADKGYDSDTRRPEPRGRGFVPVSPHRKTRTRPPAVAGRLRRYRRRSLVERANPWQQRLRRAATRWERYRDVDHGFVQPACALL